MTALSIAQRVKTGWQRVRRHKLITNAAAYVSGYTLVKGASLLLSPVWAFFLMPEDYGITGTLGAYGAFLSTLLLMGMHGAAVRHYYDHTDNPDRQKSHVTSIVLFQMIITGLVTLALDTWGPALWARYTAGKIPFDPYVRLMLWYTYIANLISIPQSLYQAQQKARQFVLVGYGKFALLVAANLILVAGLRWGAYGLMLGQLIAACIVATVVLYLATRTWFTPHVEWSYVRASLAFGLPLVPHLVASWALQSVDRVILERFVSLGEIGLYNFGYNIGMAMHFLVMGINQAWSPYYYRLMQKDPHPEEKIVKVVSIYLALIGGACLLGMLFSGEAIYLVMPARYYGAVPYVVPVLMGYLMLGLYYFVGMPFFYYKKTAVLPVLTSVAAAINIVLNIWLVPRVGAIASAWATTATYGILFLLVFLVGRRYQKVNYPLFKYGVAILIIFTSGIATTQLGILDAWSLLAKLALLSIYAVAVYVALLVPYGLKVPRLSRAGS